MTYGLGTRSYNRSAEARQNKQAVKRGDQEISRWQAGIQGS